MTGFYLAAIAMTASGLAILFKVAGWPSQHERKSTVARAVRAGAGGTTASLGLLILYLVRTAPGELPDGWSVAWLARSLLFCAVPMFILMTAGAYVQFLIWERNRPKWNRRIHDIVDPRASGKDNQ